VLLVSAVLALPARALAQVPPLPGPVQDGVNTVITTVVPAANQVAVTVGPDVTPAGFALRSPCGVLGGAIVVAAIAGVPVPVSLPVPVGIGTFAGPALILCSYSYETGPADAVFATIDGAIGPSISGAIDMAVSAADGELGTVRSTVGPGCVAALVVEPGFTNAPPPLNRLDPFHVVC
jgi:hypothetical protein